jgi:nicotinamidase-related amidase
MARRWWEWEPVFALEAGRCALLVVDMQRGFVEPGAPLEVPMARDQVGNIRKLVDFFHQIGRPVVYTRFCVDADAHYVFYWKIAQQRGLHLEPPHCQFWDGRRETEITPELTPAVGDLVIKKFGYDAFSATPLDALLRARSVDTVVVTGTVVNWCVDSTVRGAFHRGYYVVVVADCVSGYDHAGLTGEQWCQAELDHFAEAFGRVLTSDQLIDELSRNR